MKVLCLDWTTESQLLPNPPLAEILITKIKCKELTESKFCLSQG